MYAVGPNYSGISEEFFFRGFVTSLIANYTSMPSALAASSVIFGFARYFIFGTVSILGKLVLFFLPYAVLMTDKTGGYFAYTFWASGYNLAVPIIVHTLYKFVSMYGTWYYASMEIKEELKVTKESVRQMLSKEPEMFREICRKVRIHSVSTILNVYM